MAAEHSSKGGAAESAFWAFSLRLYGRPGVPASCLELQDRAGVDVNVMLFLLFLADGGRSVDAGAVAATDAHVRQWRDRVVRPLREIRRGLKEGADDAIAPLSEEGSAALRSEVKRIELESERIEQLALERLMVPSTQAASREAAARHNLDAYAAYLGTLPPAPVRQILEAFSEKSTA